MRCLSFVCRNHFTPTPAQDAFGSTSTLYFCIIIIPIQRSSLSSSSSSLLLPLSTLSSAYGIHLHDAPFVVFQRPCLGYHLAGLPGVVPILRGSVCASHTYPLTAYVAQERARSLTILWLVPNCACHEAVAGLCFFDSRPRHIQPALRNLPLILPGWLRADAERCLLLLSSGHLAHHHL